MTAADLSTAPANQPSNANILSTLMSGVEIVSRFQDEESAQGWCDLIMLLEEGRGEEGKIKRNEFKYFLSPKEGTLRFGGLKYFKGL